MNKEILKFKKFIINNIVFVVPVIFLLLVFIFLANSQRERFKSHEEKIFDKYENYIFGIDISHYQSNIDWSHLGKLPENRKISFVFIRASVGNNAEDEYFYQNWLKAKQYGYIRGAYHYYRPDENSIEQANNFISLVRLEKGDLPPVLDIEKEATVQSMTKLKKGLKKWLNKIEKYYGMRPIIYTADTYYRDFLSDTAFRKYKFWIANYNRVFQPQNHDNWAFWQFTQTGKIKGIKHDVDFNVFSGTLSDLKRMTKK